MALAPVITSARAQSAGSPEAMALDYVIQKVCVDQGDRVLPVDPIACPAGDHLRGLRLDEALPYHKHDQPGPGHPDGYQRHDSYPMRDVDGRLFVASPFVFQPFDHFEPATGDGYDLFSARDGWVSVGSTEDGGGFSTTFFGEGCKPYNGWVFFNFASVTPSGVKPGEVDMPISGRYWEQNGDPWPGQCPAAYSRDSHTSWETIPQYRFGGVGGNPVKPLDTVRVIHGFEPSQNFRQHGHLEVFYFTKIYGITRWEVWVPDEQILPTTDEKELQRRERERATCGGDPAISYQGVAFTRTACRDWSAVSVTAAPEPPTVWPIPSLNLLRNFHFGSDVDGWVRVGQSQSGHEINWALRNSSLARDTRYVQPGGKGVRYLAINCGGPCTDGEAIYQDIPVGATTPAGRYVIGLTAKSEGDPAEVAISLAQIDETGAVLSSQKFTTTVPAQSERFGPDISVVLASGFHSAIVPMTPDPRAKSWRFSVSPLSGGQTLDIVAAWLMRVPG